MRMLWIEIKLQGSQRKESQEKRHAIATSAIDFGQFRLRRAFFFEFGQFRLRHTTAREPKRAHFRASALQKHQQNSTKGPQREKEERKLWREEGKKARNFGRSGGGLSGGGLSGGGLSGGGLSGGGSIGNGVQGSGFRVQFKFLGTKTETEQKQNEERDE